MSEQRDDEGDAVRDDERDADGRDAGDETPVSDPDPKGIREGLEESEGDPKLVFLLGVVLSAWFGWVVVWGFDLLGIVEYTAVNVLTAAILVFALTYVLVLQ